jgi:hypothetical protein
LTLKADFELVGHDTPEMKQLRELMQFEQETDNFDKLK